LVVEHSFVTTLSGHDALSTATTLLSRIGFAADSQGGAVANEVEQMSIQMKRGKKTVRLASSPLEYPQRIRIDWDRGRVVVAASIETLLDSQQLRLKKEFWEAIARKHSAPMLALATGLEDVLSGHREPDAVLQGWLALEEPIRRQAEKRRRVIRMIMWIIVVLFVGLIAVCVLGEIYHWPRNG
jgi:hypothetical protein